ATQKLRAYKAIETDGVFEWVIDEEWDLSATLPEGISATDVIPDFEGDFWFITGFAHVGHLDAETGESRTLWLAVEEPEVIGAAFAVGPEGAYVLTSKAMYMFVLDDCGTPTIQWRWEYGDLENPDLSTPTLHDEGRLVTFSINHGDDTSELVVMKTDPLVAAEDRLVCRLGLFEPGKSAIQNTVAAHGRSIIAQNNFGGAFYEVGAFEPGLARVDVREDHSGCDIVWQDDTISSQVPPRLSTGDGHVWLYAYKRGEPEDVHAYYLTALDFETGEVVSEIFVASGKRMDNPMLSIDFLPGGVMVGGVRNGILSVCDAADDGTGTPVCTLAEGETTPLVEPEVPPEEVEPTDDPEPGDPQPGTSEPTDAEPAGGCDAGPSSAPSTGGGLWLLLLGAWWGMRTRRAPPKGRALQAR
ncbi:MAG: hypothetical protein QF464_20065, partial [Myxococcota bacterium]|nr:hypothetical protein [Myxococcota bacterium]